MIPEMRSLHLVPFPSPRSHSNLICPLVLLRALLDHGTRYTMHIRPLIQAYALEGAGGGGFFTLV